MRHSYRGARQVLKAIAYGLCGGFIVLIVVAVLVLNSRPDLEAWQKVDLEEEFTADSDVQDFAGYLALENRLYQELDRKVYGATEPADPTNPGVNRYRDGSLADPRHYAENGNRTFVLPPENGAAPTAGVLLLHGMSDSPYSLKSLAKRFHEKGAYVIGLRLPGHGTAPSGLVSFTWEDMHAAVVLAMQHLREQVGDRPLYLAGYSNGGALSVHYALASLENDSLPRAEGIVLVSPAIGVTPMAALAIWQSRLGSLLGLDKLAWNSILPEYDPYKYASFAVNAGDQVYRLTKEIERDFKRLESTGKLTSFPRTIAFQSVVDATVSTPALIEGLFSHLPAGTDDYELVIYDINRAALIDSLMVDQPTRKMELIASRPENDFRLTVLTNRSAPTPVLVERTFRKGQRVGDDIATGLEWPRGIYSLSHVSLPFSPGDELYGDFPPSPDHYRLGMVALRGERGVLQISANDQLRLRWNPFYDFQTERAFSFLGLSPR
ncbi:MAG: alpha/beta fold hydrolase [Verrucomicrobiae bacterium]|nr:alpha/beta fold hydrolase [Verrucomicrobiae bacterium]